LLATVLSAWLEAGFHLPAGEAALATEDVDFLIANLPGSNEILAAVAGSTAQIGAVRGLAAAAALQWAQLAAGERRQPYRAEGKDLLFQRLIELPKADETLLWRLLVEDEGSSAAAMSWSEYGALLTSVRPRLEAGKPASPKLQTYFDTVARLENRALPQAFADSQIDLRRVLALLATHPTNEDGVPAPIPAQQVLPLAAFHLQETNADLKERAGELLQAALRQSDVIPQLQAAPDNVLNYLRRTFCAGNADLRAAGHWIEAELSRRADAYRVERLLRPARTRRVPEAASAPAASAPIPTQTIETTPAAAPPAAGAVMPGARRLPRVPRLMTDRASPAPPPPPSDGAALSSEPQPLLGELALPEAGPARRDSAGWLWFGIVAVALLIVGVLIGAVIWIQSLGT
jgi:hypothetical protein